MMAATDPSHGGLSPEDIRDERLISALCRNARLQNEEIHKKRQRLRAEIRKLEEQSYAIEGRYWQEYQQRLAEIADSNPKWSTRKWISAFGANEKKLSEAVQKRQDKLREEARVKQQELETVDGEFWGAWGKHVDIIRDLVPLPSSSGLTPSAMVSIAPHQSTDGQANGALPVSHSSSGDQGDSSTHSTNGKKSGINSNGRPAILSLPKLSIVTSKTTKSQAQHFGQDLEGLAGAALQAAEGASPLAAPADFARGSPSDPNNHVGVKKQRHLLPSSATAVAPAEQEDGLKSRYKALTPRSLTPKSTKPGVESQREPSPESTNNESGSEFWSVVGCAKFSSAAEETASNAQSVQASPAAEPPILSPPLLLDLITQPDQDDTFAGVTDPVPGELYQAFYKDAHYEGWWMCTLLPWDSWERQIGIKFSFQQANLFKDLPDCYTTDRVRAKAKGRRMKPIIKGWKKGFEVGGPKARERVFPVLFFDDTPGEPGNFTFPPPEKAFTFSKQALKALPAEWVAAANLRLPGVNVGRPVKGCETAARFRERVQALREAQAKKKLATPTKSSRALSSSVAASSPLAASSKEDVDMADAESLSGATAVDDTPRQLPTPFEDMTDRPAKRSPKGFGRGWRGDIHR